MRLNIMPGKRDIPYFKHRLDVLKQKRNNYDQKWQELAIFCDPRNAYFKIERPNGTLTQLIPKTDDTAQLNLPLYAAVLNSMVTPQAYRWHKMVFANPAIQSQYGKFLDEQNNMLFNLRYSAYSNFSAAINEVYMSGGVFGHGILQLVPDLKHKRISYYALPVQEFYIDKDAFGYINTFYRVVDMKMRALLQQFPDYLPDKYKNRDDLKWLDDNITVLNAVEPSLENEDKYTYAWIDLTNMQYITKTVDEDYCCFQCYRASVFPSSDDPYGFSPCMSILPSIKALNSLQFNFLKQTDMVGQPTLLTNSDIIDATHVTANGSVVEGGLDDEGRPMVQALRLYGEMPALDYQITNLQGKVKQALLVNYLSSFSETQSRSAADAMIKANEKANLVAPSGDRLARELLLPMIEAELKIYGDMNILPPMPPELAKLPSTFDIVLDNPLLKGQRMDSANSLMSMIGFVTQLAGIDANAVSTINTDKVIRYLQNVMNVPASLLNTTEEVDAINEAKAQAADMSALVNGAPQVAGAIKDIAQAEKMLNGE